MQRATELHHLLPCTWQVHPVIDGLKLVAPKYTAAEELLQGAKQSLKDIATRLGVDLLICSDDQAQPIERIPGSDRKLAFGLEVPSSRDLSRATDAELMVAIAGSEVSACITTTGDNKIVAANFAVTPSHGKPYHQMIGSDLTPLWDVEELGRIMRSLKHDKGIRELEYWSWKWTQEADGSYNRTKQELVRHAYLIQFDGVPCRLTLGV
ncbi:hypothetical protein H6F90_29760 [Trichocoleus sp. FACHB-591]|uniref:hypothetical protein n=1 Tax=Trichocoleus sp. FACHB-591 TaxID=2692872 RepID=UPI0016847A99|nr:hypothetical protein [Trichocoleus sp. FACHB-591]MBD2099253.1 hypothetical protein [Trichocoleus sp. FACHB-591]